MQNTKTPTNCLSVCKKLSLRRQLILIPMRCSIQLSHLQVYTHQMWFVHAIEGSYCHNLWLSLN